MHYNSAHLKTCSLVLYDSSYIHHITRYINLYHNIIVVSVYVFYQNKLKKTHFKGCSFQDIIKRYPCMTYYIVYLSCFFSLFVFTYLIILLNKPIITFTAFSISNLEWKGRLAPSTTKLRCFTHAVNISTLRYKKTHTQSVV